MNITKNTISNVILSLSKGVAGLILIPILIAQLGKESYGLIVLLLGIISYADLFDVGLKQALVRSLAAEDQDVHAENQLVTTAFIGSLVYYLVSVSFILFSVFFLGHKLGVPESILQGRGIYLFIAGYLLINILNPIFSALILSQNRFDVVNYRASFFSIFGILLTILLVYITNWGYAAWMVAALISKFLEFLTMFYLGVKYYPSLRFNLMLFSWPKLKSLLSFGWKMLVSKWNKKIKFDSDALVLSYFLGPASLAIYRPGAAIVQSVRPIVSSLAGQLFVLASTAHRNKNKKSLHFLLLFGSKFTVLAYIPIFMIMLFCGEWIINLWLNDLFSLEEIHLIYQVMVLWSMISLFFYLEGSSYSVLFGIDQLDFMIKADFIVSLTNLICSVLLLYYTDLGVISVLIPAVLMEGFVRVFFFLNTAQRIDLSFRICWTEYLRPVTVVFISLILPLLAISYWVKPAWVGIIIILLMIGVYYPLICWNIAMNQSERNLFRAKFGKFHPVLDRLLAKQWISQ